MTCCQFWETSQTHSRFELEAENVDIWTNFHNTVFGDEGARRTWEKFSCYETRIETSGPIQFSFATIALPAFSKEELALVQDSARWDSDSKPLSINFKDYKPESSGLDPMTPGQDGRYGSRQFFGTGYKSVEAWKPLGRATAQVIFRNSTVEAAVLLSVRQSALYKKTMLGTVLDGVSKVSSAFV